MVKSERKNQSLSEVSNAIRQHSSSLSRIMLVTSGFSFSVVEESATMSSSLISFAVEVPQQSVVVILVVMLIVIVFLLYQLTQVILQLMFSFYSETSHSIQALLLFNCQSNSQSLTWQSFYSPAFGRLLLEFSSSKMAQADCHLHLNLHLLSLIMCQYPLSQVLLPSMIFPVPTVSRTSDGLLAKYG